MSRKTRPQKRSQAKRIVSPARSMTVILRERMKLVAGLILFALVAGVGYASSSPSKTSDLITPAKPTVSPNAAPSPVRNVASLSPDELADIPYEALHPQPPMLWYNASSGGFPPGALPAGVVLPGITQPIAPPPQGYGVYDGVRQQFTGQERDSETGLDYFHARYYSSAQGRFTSPDEFAGGPQEVNVLGKGDSIKQALPYADITNPQSLNKYSYAYNNPLRYVDNDGHCPVCIVVAVIAILASAEYVNAPGPSSPIYPSGTGQRDLVNNIFIGEMTGAAFRAVPLVARMAFGRLFADEAVSAVESRIVANAAQGAKFESRVLGIVGETKTQPVSCRVKQREPLTAFLTF